MVALSFDFTILTNPTKKEAIPEAPASNNGIASVKFSKKPSPPSSPDLSNKKKMTRIIKNELIRPTDQTPRLVFGKNEIFMIDGLKWFRSIKLGI